MVKTRDREYLGGTIQYYRFMLKHYQGRTLKIGPLKFEVINLRRKFNFTININNWDQDREGQMGIGDLVMMYVGAVICIPIGMIIGAIIVVCYLIKR